jgi:shikimate dehydrogenase
MHNAAFKHLGLNMVYVAFQVEGAAEAAMAVRTLDLRGASVTVPHKESIMAHLDEVDETSKTIGAVNTVFNRRGRLLGYNTDWLGVVSALEQVTDLAGKSCLVLGAGGAARAAVYGTQKTGATVFIMNRSENRGQRLAAEMQCNFAPWQAWDKLELDVVINATPVGMSPNEKQSPVPAERLRAGMVIMDMVYKPVETTLLRDAQTAGCLGVSGLDMLLYQGAAQLEIWTSADPPVEIMRRALIEALEDETDQAH